MKGDIMDNILYEKPKGAIKKWAIAGIITSILFFVSYVFVDLYYYQMVTLMYGTEPGGLDYASIFLSVNGLFGTAAVVFFIGIFIAKKRQFFISFLLWALLLLDLYFVMPSISSLVQMFAGYTGMDLMYYLGLILPQTLVAVLLVSFILQKDSQDKKTTRVLSWVSLIAGVVLFVFQIIYVLMNTAQAGTTNIISMGYNLSGAAIIAFIVCLSGVILMASKKPSETGGDKTKEVPAEEEEESDEELDEVVEKIAQQVCKGDEPPSEIQEPDED